MAIEIRPQPKTPRIPIGITIRGVVCLVLLIFLASSYLFFYFMINKMDREIEAKEEAAASLTRNIQEKEGQIIPISQRISAFTNLIKNHESPHDLFLTLEKNTLPYIQFSEFSLDESRVSLSGVARNFAVLEQQVNIFKKEPIIKSIALTSISVPKEEQGINFSLQLEFKPELFKPSL